ncbi:MAG: hypothetical protein ABS69_10780 [Nitrosomonadales bacterium SCN 54-20]|nr:MAG: hypothetical protein ABS69_10780 [Nitrosomonadales bacterium SCN 54-20]
MLATLGLVSNPALSFDSPHLILRKMTFFFIYIEEINIFLAIPAMLGFLLERQRVKALIQ